MNNNSKRRKSSPLENSVGFEREKPREKKTHRYHISLCNSRCFCSISIYKLISLFYWDLRSSSVPFNLCLFPSFSLPKWVLEIKALFSLLLLCKFLTSCRLLLIENLGHRFLIPYLTTRLGEKGFSSFLGFWFLLYISSISSWFHSFFALPDCKNLSKRGLQRERRTGSRARVWEGERERRRRAGFYVGRFIESDWGSIEALYFFCVVHLFLSLLFHPAESSSLCSDCFDAFEAKKVRKSTNPFGKSVYFGCLFADL